MSRLINFHKEKKMPNEASQVQYSPNLIMQFFAYAHLPEHLQAISKPFCETAEWVDQNIPSNPEKSTALRKLLEAKDCAVRAVLFK
jgi:hypothetical protein